MPRIARTSGRWVTRAAAARIIDIPYSSVGTLITSGVITTRQLPGLHVELLREDVERVAREALVPAKVGA